MSEDRLIDGAVTAAAGGGGFAGAFLALRWLVNWLTGRMDRRQALLDQQDARIDQEWKQIRDEMKERLDKIETQNGALRVAFHHVAGALVRVDPSNPALLLAEQILAQAFPLDLNALAAQAGAAIDSIPPRG